MAEERPKGEGWRIAGLIGGGIALLLIGLVLGWYLFYRPLVTVTVQAPPAPPPPAAAKPDPAALAALDQALDKQRKTNKELEDQIGKLREALAGNVCTITDPRGLMPQAPGTGPASPVPTGPGNTPGPASPLPKGADATKPGDKPAAPTGTAADLAPLLQGAVVLILSDKGNGTGFFIAPDLVMTNRHVVAQAFEGDKVIVTSRAMGKVRVGQVIASAGGQQAGGSDFALIRMVDGPVPGAKPLPLAVEPTALKEVVAAGYPGAIVINDRNFQALLAGNPGASPEVVMTRGEVSAVQNRERGMPSIAHTAAISSGNSGGPLIDRCGRVVGINTFVTHAQAGQGGGFAIGSSGIVQFLKSAGATYQWQADPCAK